MALTLYLILGTATYLCRRLLAQHFPDHNRLVNAFLYVIFFCPLGLGVAFVTSPDMAIGWTNFALILVSGAIFPAVALMAYRANRDVDAGVYGIFSNISPIVSIVLASLWLHEELHNNQLLGAAVILLAAIIVTLPYLKKRAIRSKAALFYTLGAVTLFGVGVVYERFMLTRMDLGSYTIYAWFVQAAAAVLIAWPDRKALPQLLNRKSTGILLIFGIATSLRALFFVVALSRTHNASVVSAFASVLPVLVVLAAYVVLKERKWLWLKLGAAVLGIFGLVLLEII